MRVWTKEVTVEIKKKGCVCKIRKIIDWKALVVDSIQFSRSVVSDSLWPHGLRHGGLPCPSPTLGVCSNSCPLSWWYHLTISSSVVPSSSCLQSFPASGSFLSFFFPSFIFISWRLISLQYCSGFCHTLTWISHGFTCIPHPDAPSHLPLCPIPLETSASGSFLKSHFFASDGQSIGASSSASVFTMNIQDWFPLGLTGLISLQSKELSRVFSNTIVQKHQFFRGTGNKGSWTCIPQCH